MAVVIALLMISQSIQHEDRVEEVEGDEFAIDEVAIDDVAIKDAAIKEVEEVLSEGSFVGGEEILGSVDEEVSNDDNDGEKKEVKREDVDSKEEQALAGADLLEEVNIIDHTETGDAVEHEDGIVDDERGSEVQEIAVPQLTTPEIVKSAVLSHIYSAFSQLRQMIRAVFLSFHSIVSRLFRR